MIVRTLLLLLLLPLIALAQDQLDTSYKEQLEQDIQGYQNLYGARDEQLAEIDATLGRTASSLKKRIEERDRTSQDLANLRNERTTLLNELATLQEEQQATEARIIHLDANLETLELRIQSLLINLHRQRNSRFARILGQAETFHELNVKNYYLGLLALQDAALVNEINQTVRQLSEAQNTLIAQLESLRQKRAALDENEQALTGKQQDLLNIITELESSREGQLAQQRALLEEQRDLEAELADLGKKLTAEVERLKREEERLRREAAQTFVSELERSRLLREADQTRTRIDNLTRPPSPLATGFVPPLSELTVVSAYGQGNAPFMALRAQGPNAPVLSMQEGVVIEISVVSANDGYLVAIQHSRELITVYTNLRPPQVAIGDRVERGQVIGHLGGGTLVPSDVLKLWVQVVDQSGRSAFVDPAKRLGL